MAKQPPHCPNLPWMIDFHATSDRKTLNNQMKAAFAVNSLSHRDALSIKSPLPKCRLTEFMIPIPPDASIEMLRKLVENGMNIALFKMQDFPDEEALGLLMEKLAKVNETYSIQIGRVYPLAIAFELKGTGIRTGNLKGKSRELELCKGDITNLTADTSYQDVVDKDFIYLNFPQLTDVVKSGDKIMLGSESVTLSALDAAEHILKCIVEKAGKIINQDIVSIKSSPIAIPDFAIEDEKCFKFAVKQHIDMIILPDIMSSRTFKNIQEKLHAEGGNFILLISKIETMHAVNNIREIIRDSDAVLIDGDKLILELGPEKLFIIHKSITAKCLKNLKPVLTSIEFSKLKKTDIMEISNVINDSVDCLLLSKYPNLDDEYFSNLVKLKSICIEAEAAAYSKQLFQELADNVEFPDSPHIVIACGILQIALKVNAAAIILLTVSGRTAKIVSSFRPRCPIIAITRSEKVAQQLHLFRGIDSLFYVKGYGSNWETDTEDRLQLGMTYGKYMGYIRCGDAVITVKGFRPGSGFSNLVRLVYASSFDIEYKSTKN